jgi:deoxyribodipyrimidine photo-lyase
MAKKGNETNEAKEIKEKIKIEEGKHISVHIFRSDLSIYDNTALEEAAKKKNPILCFFIYTPEQVKNNRLPNPQSLQFLHQSLIDLESQISKFGGKLHHVLGTQDKIVASLIDTIKSEGYTLDIYLNDDYSEYAMKRDAKIRKVCEARDIYLLRANHKSICNIEETRQDNGKLYQVFTPFYRRAKQQKVREPKTSQIGLRYCFKLGTKTWDTLNRAKAFKSFNMTNIDYLSGFYEERELRQTGGRKEALKILGGLKSLKDYQKTRDTLIIPTSGLSAHIKFGTVTVREVYKAAKKSMSGGAGKGEAFIRQLYWRDFYYCVALNFAEKYPNQSIYTWQRDINIDPMPEKKRRKEHARRFKAWKEGKTGFPVIDAAMREIAQTGFMHNRMRMAVASFLAKTLMLNWRKGERYFAEALVDYDFCMNFGNWCWVVGNMSHSQAPFRILSPWAQSKKADPDARYIKKWVPELKDVPASQLHQWDEYCDNYNKKDIGNYPKPIIDYSNQRKVWSANYRKLLRK